MKQTIFFKARSRLGLANPPIGKVEPNIGVEDGPDAILTPQFLSRFSESSIYEFDFSRPEEIPAEHFNKVLAGEIEKFRDLILANTRAGDRQIVVGGDHSVTLPSALALLQRIGDPEKIGYIQFDSHGDMNLAGESPTGNFHGMYVRALLDKFDIPEIEALVPQKLSPQNMLYIGNLDLDKGERKYFEDQKIKNITSNDIGQSLEFVKNFVSRFPYLHISFDIDAMDKFEAPATGIPADQGLLFEQIESILKIISRHPNVSLDLVEVNPKKEGAEKTVGLAQKIIKTLLSVSLSHMGEGWDEVGKANSKATVAN